MFTHTHIHTFISTMDMIAIIGTSDQPCWLAKFSSSSCLPSATPTSMSACLMVSHTHQYTIMHSFWDIKNITSCTIIAVVAAVATAVKLHVESMAFAQCQRTPLGCNLLSTM